jgi:Mitochondrial carrier protein
LPSPSFGVIQSRRSSYHSDPRIQKYSTPSQSRSVPVKRSSSTTRVSKKSSSKLVVVSNPQPQGPLHFLKIALAGGIAGAVGSSALYPMDAAKTLRQSKPSEYSSVFHALGNLARTKTATGEFTWHIQKVYRGVIPAAVGAIPSSALYFGAYESMKALLKRRFPLEGDCKPVKGVKLRKNTFPNRLLVHALAAMSGNVLSSAVFVPKELVKQQLQYRQSGNVLGVMVDILTTKGLGGMYLGYKATLLRNIPTAVLRFSLYEEFRYRWTDPEERDSNIVSPKFFLAGAAAGVLASGVMTPVDVLKTRLATGTCPVDVRSCFLWVIQQEGIAGLYSGAGSRMVFSGAFSAIGFGTFEWAKGVLGVAKPEPSVKAVVSSKLNLSKKKFSMSSEAGKDGKNQNPSSKAKVLLAARQ